MFNSDSFSYRLLNRLIGFLLVDQAAGGLNSADMNSTSF